MARISGIDLPREKRIEIGLQYIYGIGPTTSAKLLAKSGVNPDTRVKDLTEDDEKRIREAIDGLSLRVEGDLRREVQGNIKRLMDIGCYRGVRHRKGLTQAYGRREEEGSYQEVVCTFKDKLFRVESERLHLGGYVL